MFSHKRAVYGLLLLVLAAGIVASRPDAFAGDQAKSKKKSDQSTQQTTKVDLNAASEKDLDSLPGVGPATVKKIVGNRPYSSVDDLKKAGVSQSEIEKIRPLVTVSAPSNSSDAGAASKAQSPNLPQSDKPNVAPPPGSGMVWVNLDSKVYHREGDPWYGKTKHGEYMSEQDAQKAGYRPAKVAGRIK